MTIAVLPGFARPLLEARLPEWIDAHWWHSADELVALAAAAEIGWFDLHDKPPMLEAVARARGLRWLNSVYAGLDCDIPGSTYTADSVKQSVLAAFGAGANGVIFARNWGEMNPDHVAGIGAAVKELGI